LPAKALAKLDRYRRKHASADNADAKNIVVVATLAGWPPSAAEEAAEDLPQRPVVGFSHSP